MAKKIVRGITDVKTINNQDYDTNNVNDLLSDGQYNYIHRKKGENEEYHNLTDNIKTISSDNTELLSVTNNNKTTNTATLSPKHDAQKEQVLESTRNTVTINHGTNGTAEKTTVDVNFDKVQAKLTAGDGLSIDNNKISIKPTSNGNPLNNGFFMRKITGDTVSSSVISLESESNRIVQLAFRESVNTPNVMIMRYRFVNDNVATDWKLATIDNEQLLTLLSQKQDTLVAGEGITIQGNTVDTNPQKVLEHENLLTINGISKVTEGNSTTIGLKIIDNYSGDLNELTEICLVKPTDAALHLPGLDDGIQVIAHGEGILTVVKIGDTVSQKYHTVSNELYTRLGEYSEGEWGWSKWTGAGAIEPPTPS